MFIEEFLSEFRNGELELALSDWMTGTRIRYVIQHNQPTIRIFYGPHDHRGDFYIPYPQEWLRDDWVRAKPYRRPDEEIKYKIPKRIEVES